MRAPGGDVVNGGGTCPLGSSNPSYCSDNEVGGGDDTLYGRELGRRRAIGGSGADRISGGSGNDVISARDGRRDRVSCGSGSDRVTADRRDKVAKECEKVTRR